MNRVGREGRGESVWLAWFHLAVLPRFAAMAESRGDAARAHTWTDHVTRLREAVEEAWDGAWYRRAYFDDGSPLGAAINTKDASTRWRRPGPSSRALPSDVTPARRWHRPINGSCVTTRGSSCCCRRPSTP
jgi:hypothetical protein